jgi:hypothetical protein
VRGKGTEGRKQQGFSREKKSEGKGPKQYKLTRGKKNQKRETKGVFLEERRHEKSGDREGRNRTE